jgi:ATP-dependent exoDNAse (exonuclease V) alpha subunit
MNSSDLINLLQDRNIFLSGGAGVGKSYLTNEIISQYEKNGKNVIPLGSTGISAVNIGGYTLHSFFVFGIAKDIEELKSYDNRNKKRVNELKKILKETDLIIIDEISMVSSALMDMIYYRLFSLGFAGKLMVVGDFYQLPPIVKKDSKNSLFKEEVYAFESSSWKRFDFYPVILSEVKRTTNKEFAYILEKIRKGICDSEVKSYLASLKETKLNNSSDATYLFGRNAEADSMNKKRLLELNSDENFYYWSINNIAKVNEKRLESWSKNLPINEILHLKVGAKVIFSVNSWGKYVNGQKGVVVEVDNEHIVVRSKGRDINVTQHDFELSEIDSQTLENKVVATISQYPLKLAYAITIHKSQGMSLDSLVCNLDYLFAPNQLYVAISRATDPKSLKIEYSRGDFNSYLSRVIVQNSVVDEFYGSLGCED